MKIFNLLIALFIISISPSFAQDEFELKPSQSMLMTGKGPGQDGSINPYAEEDCYAYVTNIGEYQFSVRIQKKGEVIESYNITKGEKKKIVLLKDQELYIDGNDKEKAKAKITYKKMVAY